MQAVKEVMKHDPHVIRLKRRVLNMKRLQASCRFIHLLCVQPDNEDVSWLDKEHVTLISLLDAEDLRGYSTKGKVFVCYYKREGENILYYLDKEMKDQVPTAVPFMAATTTLLEDVNCNVIRDAFNSHATVLTQERYKRRLSL